MTTKRAEYDSPWKNILTQFLQPFLEFSLLDLATQIDWSRGYISLDKELIAIGRKQAVGKRIADTLFKVWLKTGKEMWLLLHIEVQGEKETDFSERFYIYNYRIFDRYQKPIVSVAILADDNPNWRPIRYQRDSPYNKLSFEFATIKLLDYTGKENELKKDPNPFAIVVLAHLGAIKTKKQPRQRLGTKIVITRSLYERGFSKDYVLDLFSFIDWILALPEPLELEYAEVIEHIEEEKHVRYITSVERILIKKYKEQGREELVLKLIKADLLKAEQIHDLTGLSLKAIAALCSKVKIEAH